MSFVRKVQVLSPTSDISNCASRTCLCNLHLQLYIYIYIYFFFFFFGTNKKFARNIAYTQYVRVFWVERTIFPKVKWLDSVIVLVV